MYSHKAGFHPVEGVGGKLPSQNTQLPPQKKREKERKRREKEREGGRGVLVLRYKSVIP
jgi:hypothetical protein